MAPDDDVRLASLGIHVATDADAPGVRAECSRIARGLLATRKRIVGLIPSTPDAAVPPVAIQLGLALTELSGAHVALIDANVHWPALSRLVEDAPTPADDEAFFATRWLRGSLALLTPPRAREPGAGMLELERLLAHGRERFHIMLADLTGFDVLGEHHAAMALVDGVVLVAPAGHIREHDLLRWNREVPAAHRLGVLLVGPG